MNREHPTGTERKSLNYECGWKGGDRGGLAGRKKSAERKKMWKRAKNLRRPRASCSVDGFLIFRTLRFHCCDLRLVTTALNLDTSVMSRPVNTIVLPLGRSTPGR